MADPPTGQRHYTVVFIRRNGAGLLWPICRLPLHPLLFRIHVKNEESNQGTKPMDAELGWFTREVLILNLGLIGNGGNQMHRIIKHQPTCRISALPRVEKDKWKPTHDLLKRNNKQIMDLKWVFIIKYTWYLILG